MTYCTHCGKEIADEAVICLNCGCRVSGPKVIPKLQSNEYNGKNTDKYSESSLATWSKICGITSFFVGWFALGIAAIVLAYLSKEDTGGILSSSAKVGYVCGIISTVLSLILFVIIVAFLVFISI